MRTLVHEGVAVVGANAEDLDASGIDEISKRADQPGALQLPLIALARGERQHGRSKMSEDRDTEFVAKPR